MGGCKRAFAVHIVANSLAISSSSSKPNSWVMSGLSWINFTCCLSGGSNHRLGVGARVREGVHLQDGRRSHDKPDALYDLIHLE